LNPSNGVQQNRMSMPVLMLQLSLRDNVPLRIPFRGLKPTATIKSRSATKCNGLELDLTSRNETFGRGSLYCASLIRGREQYRTPFQCHVCTKAGLTPLGSLQSHQVEFRQLLIRRSLGPTYSANCFLTIWVYCAGFKTAMPMCGDPGSMCTRRFSGRAAANRRTFSTGITASSVP
jgi:hypothetical protein